MSGRRLILFIGGLLGALFLYLAVRSLEWHEFVTALAGSDLRFAAGALAAFLGYFAVKAIRWKYLVRPLVRTGTGTLLSPVIAGSAGNYVFPHAGEFVRVILAKQRLAAGASPLLASIALERIFDFAALLVIVFAVLIPVHAMSPEMRAACVAIGSLCALLLAAVALFLWRTRLCLRVAWRILGWGPRRLRLEAMRHLEAAAKGFSAIATPVLLLPIFVLSIAQWLLIIACMAACIAAVDIPATLVGVTSVLLLNVIGLTLPAAPGHVGTVQLAFMAGLAPFGVEEGAAFAASVVYNVLTVATTITLGLPGLRRAWFDLRTRFAA